MTDNARTDFVVRAKAEGFAQLRDEAGRLNEAIRGGTEGQSRALGEAQKNAVGLSRQLEQATRGLEKMEERIRKLERSLKDAGRASGAFFQGFAQGTGMGEYIQRGPGMGRQMVGIQAGRALMAPGRMAAGAAFGGVGGFTSALQTLPAGLGMLGAPIAASLGFAQQGLQFQQQLQEVAPFIGLTSLRRGPIDIARARAAGLAGAATERGSLAGEESRIQLMAGDLMQAAARRRAEAEFPQAGGLLAFGARKDREARRREIVEEMRRDPGALESFRERAIGNLGLVGGTSERIAAAQQEAERKDIAQQRNAQARSAQKDMIKNIRAQGAAVGMALPESLQFAAQLGQIRGGRGAIDEEALQTAFLARRTLGLGAGISGAFQLAGRRGGIAGIQVGGQGEGEGNQAFLEAIRQGMALHLEGSEMVSYMERMAQGIEQFQQTGIPINPTSIGEMGQVLRGGGVTETRAMLLGGAAQRFGQRIAAQGPQGGLDLMALMGAGFTGGGIEGPGGMFQAMQALEKGMTGEQFGGMLTTIGGMGGGAESGALLIKEMVKRMGGSVSLEEALGLSKAARAGEFKPEALQRRVAEGVEPTKAMEDLQKVIATLTPGIEQTAKTQNQQILTGQGMITSMNNLNAAMTDIAKMATNITGEDIKKFTGALREFTKVVEGSTKGQAGKSSVGSLISLAFGGDNP